MLFSLRNDVVAIEYPIQHFISEALRNGKFPVWFNTWNMGFPLQSVLSWGVYSTPQMLIGFLFDSNMYILHAEFIFFIIASGCCMYKLLKTHFLTDGNLSLLLSCCYMLSGFTVGSSQWLLYVTGMAFIPLTIYSLLSLLKKPSLKYSLFFPISFFLLFTNVHIYLTLVNTYILTIFLFTYFIKLFLSKDQNTEARFKLIKYVSLTTILTILICAAPAYYSFEVISYLSRSQPITNDLTFFQSNYLHPDGLSSLLLPLSSVRVFHSNTEGIIFDTYLGLLPVILFPAAIYLTIKQRNKTAWKLLLASIFFLFLSFGHLTPLRGWVNIFPGLSHFRHPGVLRIFFILFFILYIADTLKSYSLKDLFQKGVTERKIITGTIVILILILLATLLFTFNSLSSAWKESAYLTLKNISKDELLAINTITQLVFTLALFFTILKKQNKIFFIIICELIINTVICTPFFSISSYSAKDVNKILSSPDGFPVQKLSPYNVVATEYDTKNNPWCNINTYRKEISNNISMPGPLIFNKVVSYLETDSLKNDLKNREIVFINNTPTGSMDSIYIKEQSPEKVTIQVYLLSQKEIILQQANFNGWKAYYNNKRIALSTNNTPFVSTIVPAGRGQLIFKFERPGVLYTSLLLHLAVLLALMYILISKLKLRLPFLS